MQPADGPHSVFLCGCLRRGTLTVRGEVLCPVVCGRDDELRALRSAFARASAGRGSLVFITGKLPPGRTTPWPHRSPAGKG